MSRMDNLLTRPSIQSLEAALSAPAQRLLRQTLTEAAGLDIELWAVGGPVRDVAANRPLADIDLAVSRHAERLAAAVADAIGAQPSFEERFGTASLTLDGDRLDLATLRAERYSAPGALPEVTLGVPIERDLERRDFNVNAIALGLTGPREGELLDPFDGLADLARRRFAVLHERSFEDDATRIWRAARLGAQRDLRPTAATRALLTVGARWLDTISGDRLWTEFELIAERGRAGRTLRALDDWGALEAVSPALRPTIEVERVLRHRWRPLPPAQLAAVLLGRRDAATATAALRRLNAPSEVEHAVSDTRLLLATDDVDPEHLETLAGASSAARRAARWLDPRQVTLQRALGRWERTRPHLNARELMRLGVPEGPEVGTLLRCLRRGRYLGTLSTAAEARTLVRQHLEREEGAG